MSCKLRRRRDDIPKRKGEKSWECETCGIVSISRDKPRCRRSVHAEMTALRVFADAEADRLNLDQKGV